MGKPIIGVREFAFDVLPFGSHLSEAWVSISRITASRLRAVSRREINLKTAKPWIIKAKQGSLSVEGHYGDKLNETGVFKVLAVGQ